LAIIILQVFYKIELALVAFNYFEHQSLLCLGTDFVSMGLF